MSGWHEEKQDIQLLEQLQSWKFAEIIPIPEPNKSSSELSNYRPILIPWYVVCREE